MIGPLIGLLAVPIALAICSAVLVEFFRGVAR